MSVENMAEPEDGYGLKEVGWDRAPEGIQDKRVTDLMSLKGKTAIVTGAGGAGLGFALANRLAGLGADVVMTDISEMVADNARAVAEKWGTKTYPLVADLVIEAASP